jgi:pimeloyl-ACP methyl ester carboxylesterase
MSDLPRKAHPIVLVHGAWHAAWCWEEHFKGYLEEHGYTVVTPDLRNHGSHRGRSSLRWCRIADYVDDIAAEIRGLPAPPILVGHSMGGLVVQKYLETNPAQAAVLLASVPVSGALGATLRTARRIPSQLAKANLQLRLYPLIETEHLAREAFFSSDIEASRLARYFSLMQDESYLAFLDMVVLNLPRPKRVKTPMLVLGAERDAIFSPHEVQATAAAYGQQATIFPDMAHDMMLEPGWQLVADQMIVWLRDQGL